MSKNLSKTPSMNFHLILSISYNTKARHHAPHAYSSMIFENDFHA